MFMFDLNHSSLHIPMHCKIKKVHSLVFESIIKMTSRSVLPGSLTLKIKGDHAYRSGVKVGDRLFCTRQTTSQTLSQTTRTAIIQL